MSRKVLIVVASVLGMILLVGCGSVASFLVLNASPVGDAVRDAVGGKTYDQADADAALLTVDDLPGYRKESTNNQNGDNGLTPCGKALDMTTFGQAGTNRDAIFAKGETGPFVLHTVGLLNDDATLDPIRQVFKDCPNWTQAPVKATSPRRRATVSTATKRTRCGWKSNPKASPSCSALS